VNLMQEIEEHMPIWDADETGQIAVEGGTIWYRRNKAQNNSGKLPLLIIHGGPGGCHDYLLPCVTLAAERDVIFYDQLDCGRSSRTNQPELWTLARFSSEIDAVRSALNLGQLHILASSWGGTIALHYATHEPEGLASLILSGPLVNSQRWVCDNEIWRQQLPPDILQTLHFHEMREDYDHDSYLQAVSYFYHRHLCRVPQWPDHVTKAMDSTNQSLYRTMWGPTEFLCTGSLKDLDLTPQLEKIHTPTLFIAGEFDEGTFAACQDFAAQMGQAQAKMIANGAHMPHIEQPEIFFNHVRNFLQQVEMSYNF